MSIFRDDFKALQLAQLRVILFLVSAVLLMQACSTTTVHTSSRYQQRRNAELEKEKAFFESLNGKDEGFVKKAGISSKCPCKSKEEQNQNDVSQEDIPQAELTQGEIPDGQDGALGGALGNDDFNEVGIASWYGRDFDGKPTASGEVFDSRKLTAAHKKISLGSIILVRNMENNKEAFLKVNDRGPFITGRILDVSEYAAEVLGYKEEGLTHVGIRIVRPAKKGDAPEGRGATYNYFERGLSTGGNDAEEADLISIKSDARQDYYSVQIGSFTTLRLARKLQRHVKDYDQPVHLLRRESDYIVRIGSFKSRRQAEVLMTELREDGYSTFIVSPY